ncbi:hypothetical protein [Nocardia amamiensis]|uniref:hypothetical protein n=1 Tax=Nocardia amamiensis TaxID=404578 RepID=UPI0033C579BA
MRADRALRADTVALDSRPAVNGATLQPVTGSRFYTTMLAEVRRARYRIMTTYIRLRPASYFIGFTDEETSRAARAYFEGIVAWAAGPSPRSVRRVIATPTAEMTAWAQQLVRATAEYPNYRIRVIDWPLTADAVNFAIFDDAVAFLAFTTGTTQQLIGFRVTDQAFVQGAIGHFEQLWLTGRELE